MNRDREILFHLERDILSVEEMQTCITEFFAMIKSASEDCMSNVRWFAEIRQGSLAMALYPTSETETDVEIDQCLHTIRKDLRLIQGGKRPIALSTKTMRHYEMLTRSLKTDRGLSGNPTIDVIYPNSGISEPIAMVDVPTPERHVMRETAFGTAYGEVKTMYATQRPFFALYDEITGKRVKVYYADELLDTVRKCYRNYVCVTGDIIYNEDGTKHEMTAKEIEVIDRSKSVSLSDLYGIWSDAE